MFFVARIFISKMFVGIMSIGILDLLTSVFTYSNFEKEFNGLINCEHVTKLECP